ncbi:MAG TPA: 3'(2'),5'-bisphosphate nucleotidase CysQ [Gammaproteobacteria bacterium]|nr:3'(2'),5'-bisphosphate nucleotidase CysQ [Gammaproteobacteria bacterium]
MNASDEIEADRLIRSVIGISKRAADVIMAIYSTPFGVRHKSDHSPVTEADMASDALINQALTRLTPGRPVLSEESECPPFELRSKWQRYWLVDPLDGTQDFVSRRGDFTINVALVKGHVPVLGVIYVPEKESCYYARAGGGAYRMDREGGPSRLRVKDKAENPIRVVTSRSRRNPMTGAFIESLGEVRIERMGSALKSCRVAEGGADVYPGFSRTSEWDTAAAQCIVEEAGGKMIDFDGRPLRYNTRAGLRNPGFLAVGDTRRDWSRALKKGAGGGGS